MNTKPDAAIQPSAADDPVKPAFNTAMPAPDSTRYTMTQTNRDPDSGKLVTGKEGEK